MLPGTVFGVRAGGAWGVLKEPLVTWLRAVVSRLLRHKPAWPQMAQPLTLMSEPWGQRGHFIPLPYPQWLPWAPEMPGAMEGLGRGWGSIQQPELLPEAPPSVGQTSPPSRVPVFLTVLPCACSRVKASGNLKGRTQPRSRVPSHVHPAPIRSLCCAVLNRSVMFNVLRPYGL